MKKVKQKKWVLKKSLESFWYAKSHSLKDDEVGKPSGPEGQVQLDSGAKTRPGNAKRTSIGHCLFPVQKFSSSQLFMAARRQL